HYVCGLFIRVDHCLLKRGVGCITRGACCLAGRLFIAERRRRIGIAARISHRATETQSKSTKSTEDDLHLPKPSLCLCVSVANPCNPQSLRLRAWRNSLL